MLSESYNCTIVTPQPNFHWHQKVWNLRNVKWRDGASKLLQNHFIIFKAIQFVSLSSSPRPNVSGVQVWLFITMVVVVILAITHSEDEPSCRVPRGVAWHVPWRVHTSAHVYLCCRQTQLLESHVSGHMVKKEVTSEGEVGGQGGHTDIKFWFFKCLAYY